jgi:hypothetical protein
VNAVPVKKEDKDGKNVRTVSLKESWGFPLTRSIDGLGTIGPVSGTAPCSPCSPCPPHPHDETGARDPTYSMPTPSCYYLSVPSDLNQFFLLPQSRDQTSPISTQIFSFKHYFVKILSNLRKHGKNCVGSWCHWNTG